MILECPNCDTQYEIPVELPPEGRKVRCATCQHIWQAMPPREIAEAEAIPEPAAPETAPGMADAAAADETAAADAPEAGSGPAQSVLDKFSDEEIVFQDQPFDEEPQPETSSGPEAAPPPADAETADDALSDDEMADAFSAAVAEAGMAQDDVEEDEQEAEEPESAPIVIGKARKKKSVSLPGSLAAGWAALALVLTGILSIGYFQRIAVVKLLPGAASTYERIGLPVNVRGLAFKDVKYSWETSAGRPVLEVVGEIENVTSRPMKVPTVVFGLRTKEKVEVYQWAADVRADLLPPGEQAAFTAQIPTPPKSIRDVQVRFAKVQ